jgi:hypothetical protein
MDGREIERALEAMRKVKDGEKEYTSSTCHTKNLELILREARQEKIFTSVTKSKINQPQVSFYSNPFYRIIEKVFVELKWGEMPKKNSPEMMVFLMWVSGVWGESCTSWGAISDKYSFTLN